MWDWNGSRWWRVDFHAHSPGSDDYGRGAAQEALRQRSARDWLLDFMRAGIDCVVIADHNTGAWIDRLSAELAVLAEERPDGYRPLWLFPGVEISVNGGVHLLAVLAPGRTSGDVDTLLGAVGFGGTKGSSDGVTTRSLGEVVREIHQFGGLPIPAHVDGPDGLFQIFGGQTLGQVLSLPDMVAMEVANNPFKPPAQYTVAGGSWTEVAGSDSHHPNGRPGQGYPGSRYSWVKMGSPNLEGLRLALLDGPMSVLRSDQQAGDPNRHAALIVEAIEVEAARYMGRANPFVLRLNPWLNAIVGGRGTGKSTIVELVRLALRRSGEIPSDLDGEFSKYRTMYPHRDDPGLLTADTIVRVVYRKDGSRYRIQWAPGLEVAAIQEADGDTWRETEGDVAQRFPVRIYSQRQIFHLAGTPLSLLKIIDESPGVERYTWDQQWRERHGRFLALRAQARELEAGTAEEPRLRGELEDVKQRLEVFARSNHAEVLKAFETRRRQERFIDDWEASWAGVGNVLRQAADAISTPSIAAAGEASPLEDDTFLQAAATPMQELETIRASVAALAQEAAQVLARWREVRAASTLTREIATARSAYDGLVQRLAEEGAGDLTAYGTLVERQQEIDGRLLELSAQRVHATELRADAQRELEEMLAARRRLTELRRSFLVEVLRDNRYVRIRVLPYGAADSVESEYRALIQRDDAAFERDIGTPTGEGVLAELYEDQTGPAIETRLETIKRRTRAVAMGEVPTTELRDARFGTHLGRLTPETLDRLDAWFPEDSLEVEYSTTSDGTRFRAIEEASPGQKTAALLAFLLSYGGEPLFLDQPEDDLDNRLIYDLIVTQLREAKVRRQVVLVTHNANIVVNGDAELVAAMIARAGESQIDSQGSLQDVEVRNTICDVMEGGRDAFEQRYRRISLALQT